ncbi:hypothetical protein [Nonomuraea sp. LPB2021202275-12-8]|uniref:hypothetical protein n=1 Tax=Nonomuraea sp. LPB2021202275-12-8 TaxID=3120159 RepID=UPI00300D140E
MSQHDQAAVRSLTTTDHEEIRKWAEERGANPATMPGTGGLRFDFPGCGGEDLEEISWDDWFGVFDQRGLNFVYHEHRKGDPHGNYFRLRRPDDDGA